MCFPDVKPKAKPNRQLILSSVVPLFRSLLLLTALKLTTPAVLILLAMFPSKPSIPHNLADPLSAVPCLPSVPPILPHSIFVVFYSSHFIGFTPRKKTTTPPSSPFSSMCTRPPVALSLPSSHLSKCCIPRRMIVPNQF